MSYDFYKVAHFVGLFMVIMSLSAMIVSYHQSHGAKNIPQKRFLGIFHGVGLLITFVAGFGLLARLQAPMAPWVYGKMAIWLCLGMAPVIIRRQSHRNKFWYITLLVLAGLAAYLARTKPGAL